jgi:hypothetical protein
MLSDPKREGDDAERRLEIAGVLDRHAAEALRLAIERMARAEGIALTVTVSRAETKPDSA